jgi:hypothetical protein
MIEIVYVFVLVELMPEICYRAQDGLPVASSVIADFVLLDAHVPKRLIDARVRGTCTVRYTASPRRRFMVAG